MNQSKPTYQELETRLAAAEPIVAALKHHEVDAVVGEGKIAFLLLRKVEEALTKGDKAAAQAALKAAEPEIMRGVSKGILHKNTGSRKVSRLAKRVAKLAK